MFCDQGLTAMQQEREMNNVDKASTFLAAIVDANCGNEIADVLLEINRYSDRIRYIFGKMSLIDEEK